MICKKMELYKIAMENVSELQIQKANLNLN